MKQLALFPPSPALPSRPFPAIRICDCYFKPRDFVELIENERQWFEMLVELGRQAWKRAVPEESREGQACGDHATRSARWLRN